MEAQTMYPQVPCLPYSRVRPFIENGDILLCSGDAPMSRMIQMATESFFSHVAFILRLERIDRIVVLESVESIGVRTVPLKQYVSNYNTSGTGYPGRLFLARDERFRTLEASALCGFSQSAVDLLGYQYNTQEILHIAWRLMASKLNLPHRDAQAGPAYLCSQFAAQCFASVGLHFRGDEHGFIAPKDFAAAPTVQILWEVMVEGGA